MESHQSNHIIQTHAPQYVKGFSDNLIKVFSVKDASIGYEQNLVLKSLNFELYLGELVFITGKTASGKSTFLNFLYSQKEVELFSGQIERFHLDNSKLFVSRVFQDLKVFGNMSVLENLKLAYDQSVYKSYEEFLSSVESYTKILDIYDFLDKKIDRLNGATSQKLAIIRSILSKPRVILADEPTSSLDLNSTHKIYDLFNLLNHKTKLSVVWVTHDRELVRKFSGKLLHIDGKKLINMRSDCFI